MSSLAFANTKSVVPALAVSPPWINCWAADFRAAQSARSAGTNPATGRRLRFLSSCKCSTRGSAAPGSMPAAPSIQNRRPSRSIPRTTAGLTASAPLFPGSTPPRRSSVAYRGVGSWGFKNNKPGDPEVQWLDSVQLLMGYYNYRSGTGGEVQPVVCRSQIGAVKIICDPIGLPGAQ